MPDGKTWRFFNAENANKLAVEVAELVKKTGHKILITNGPRTGAFLNATKRNPIAHKNGEIDRISKAFLNKLTKAGLKKGKHFEFYDFQLGTTSAIKAIMAIVCKNKGFMIIPGDSTSSISETIAIMPTVIYRNDSMNEVHEAYLTDLLNNKLATLWPNIPAEQQMETYVPPEVQAIQVVQKLLCLINTCPH
jgi:hypothetical protein